MTEKILAVSVYYNDDLYFVAPRYTINICFKLMGSSGFIAKDAPDASLGEKIRQAFATSTELAALYIKPNLCDTSDYEAWVLDCMKKYGYKTRRVLFKKMESCSIRHDGDKFHFSPLRHCKLEAWGAEKSDSKYCLYIPADSDPELIGETLRLALENSKIMSGRSWSFSKSLLKHDKNSDTDEGDSKT